MKFSLVTFTMLVEYISIVFFVFVLYIRFTHASRSLVIEEDTFFVLDGGIFYRIKDRTGS